MEHFLDYLFTTQSGVALAFFGTWFVAWRAYKKNTADHNALGDKVDHAKSEMLESVERLGEKIDAVREAISHHETVWHAPHKSEKAAQRKRAAKKK